MKRVKLINVILAVVISVAAYAQNESVIVLDKPSKVKGNNVMKAFADRASAKEFSSEELSLQDISDLLWTANGINRPKENKRTAPTAMNSQDVEIYVVMQKGSYLYDANNHKLILVSTDDNRAMVAANQKQFANAPLFCVIVSDISRFDRGDDARKMSLAAIDAAMVSQNINIFCSGVGLKTRPRVSMDVDNLRKALKLSQTQHPILNNPVGR